MKKRILLLLLLLCCLLTACTSSTEAYLRDPITHSGDLSYYKAVDTQNRSSLFVNKHISLSGIVAAGGYTTLFLGEESKDGISFSCTFAVYDDMLAAVQPGDYVQLHGICSAVIGNIFYMEHCSLTGSTPAAPTTATGSTMQSSTAPSTAATEPVAPPATEPTITPTTEPTVPPTTEPTVPPTTEPTAPPTTEPTVPPTTEPTAPPTTEPAQPPATTPSDAPEHSYMVWIPKTGSKYHSKSTCSGMKSPSQVTKEEAESLGYTPCKRCW